MKNLTRRVSPNSVSQCNHRIKQYEFTFFTDWNKDFQTLLRMPDSEAKFRKLYHLAHDFVYAARTYAKIIISEFALPDRLKTIQPADVGGYAGGTKYVVQVSYILLPSSYLRSLIWDSCRISCLSSCSTSKLNERTNTGHIQNICTEVTLGQTKMVPVLLLSYTIYIITLYCNIAMKTAAHELKGCMSYYSCNIKGLCFPLMVHS